MFSRTLRREQASHSDEERLYCLYSRDAGGISYVEVNKYVSLTEVTKEIFSRSHCGWKSRRSRPFSKICPPWTSYRRANKRSNVDLPQPVLPQIPTALPGGIVRLRLEKIFFCSGSDGYLQLHDNRGIVIITIIKQLDMSEIIITRR